MRQAFLDSLQKRLEEQALNGWRDGWVYGRLKEEFNSLQLDELEKMADMLQFKRGWSLLVENILDNQWEQDKPQWRQQEQVRMRQEQAQKETMHLEIMK